MILILLTQIVGATAILSGSGQVIGNNATSPSVALSAKLSTSIVNLPSSASKNSIANRRNISIFMITQYDSVIVPLGPICTEAVKIGLERVRRVSKNLNNYELSVEIVDDACARQVAIAKFIEQMRRNDKTVDRLPLMLGPLCTGHYFTGQMLQHFNFMALVPGTVSMEIHTLRNIYQSMFMLAKTASSSDALALFLQAMGWYKFAIISENTDFFNTRDKRLIALIDNTNGSKQLGIAKLTYNSGGLPESDDIKNAVEELKPLDPRIIIIHSTSPSRVACWLHRYELYGPNYVFFILSPYSFLPNDPFRFSTWCTPDMLRDILQSVFYYGPTNFINAYGESAADSTGLTGGEFDRTLMERIDGPQASPQWWHWRTTCYDVVLAAGYVLDSTEAILRKRNQTLSDWIVSGDKFKEHGSDIVKLMKDALFSTRFRTLFNDIGFDNITTTNIPGEFPISFVQIQKGLSPTPVAVLERGFHLRFFPEHPLMWRTLTGRQPLDSLVILQVPTPAMSKGLFIAVTVIGVSELAVSLLILLHQIIFRKRNRLVKHSVPLMNYFILMGDIFLLGYTLVQPWTPDTSFNFYCMPAYGFLFVGLASLLYGMTEKLMLAHVVFVNARKKIMTANALFIAERLGGYIDLKVQQSHPPLNFRMLVKMAFLFGILLVFAVFIATLTWFIMDPIITRVVNTTFEISTADDSLAFQHYSFECEIGTSDIATAISCAICVIYAILLLRGFLLARIIRKKHFRNVNDARFVANCLYGTAGLVSCGAIVAGAVFLESQAKIRLTISFTSFAYIALNLGVIFLPQFLRPAKTAPMRHPGSSRNPPTPQEEY